MFLLVVLIVGVGSAGSGARLVGAVFFVYVRQELQDTQKLLFLLIGMRADVVRSSSCPTG